MTQIITSTVLIMVIIYALYITCLYLRARNAYEKIIADLAYDYNRAISSIMDKKDTPTFNGNNIVTPYYISESEFEVIDTKILNKYNEDTGKHNIKLTLYLQNNVNT